MPNTAPEAASAAAPKSAHPNILRQTILTFCGQSGGYVVAILTGIVVARTLGPAGKGVVALAMLLLAIFTTYGDGLQSAIMYQCGRRHEPENLVYAASLRLVGAVFIPVAIVLVIVGLTVPRFATAVFVAAAIPFAVYIQVANSFFLMRNRVATTLVVTGFSTFGYALVVIPALVVWHAGASAILGIWAAMYLLAGAYAWWRISTLIPPSAARTTTPAILFEQARFGFKSGSVSVAAFLNLRIDIFIVGLMLDATTLGIYSLAVATAELLWQLAQPLSWTTLGRIAVADRAASIQLTATVARNILAVMVVAGTVLFVIAPAAIVFVYGNAYAESGYVLRWLIPGTVCYAVNGVLGYYVMVREGRPLTMFLLQSGSVVTCAVLTVATLHTLGIYGAALATTITYVLSSLARGTAFAQLTGISPLSFTILQAEDIARYRRIAGRVLANLTFLKRPAQRAA
jgi:O-antigen/teichoic acid export membrane protein